MTPLQRESVKCFVKNGTCNQLPERGMANIPRTAGAVSKQWEVSKEPQKHPIREKQSALHGCRLPRLENTPEGVSQKK